MREPARRRDLLSLLLDSLGGGSCVWQLGGPFIKGTTNNFGGSSAAEFGPLLPLAYPAATPVGSPQPSFRFNNFRNVLSSNPCPA